MMWQTVTIQEPAEVIGASGGRSATWAAVSDLTDVQARVLAVQNEDPGPEMTVHEDAYEVHLRGVHPSITTKMRVLDGAAAYDIRHAPTPPPFGSPITVLDCVLVSV